MIVCIIDTSTTILFFMQLSKYKIHTILIERSISVVGLLF